MTVPPSSFLEAHWLQFNSHPELPRHDRLTWTTTLGRMNIDTGGWTEGTRLRAFIVCHPGFLFCACLRAFACLSFVHPPSVN